MNAKYYTMLLRTAAFFGFTGVVVGAFGAHYLKSKISVNDLDIIRTAILYLFIHTLAMLVIVVLGKRDELSRILKGAGVLFAIGIVLFSGSLFFIATRTLSGIEMSGIGMITPIGGLCFIAGWCLLFLYTFSKKSGN